MSWKHFYFETPAGEKVAEYSSDDEPPAVGEIIEFEHSTNGRHDIKYKVLEAWNLSNNDGQVDYFFKVEAVEV